MAPVYVITATNRRGTTRSMGYRAVDEATARADFAAANPSWTVVAAFRARTTSGGRTLRQLMHGKPRCLVVHLPPGLAQVENLDDEGKRDELAEATGVVFGWAGKGKSFHYTIAGTPDELRRVRKIFSYYCDTSEIEVPAWYARSAKAACAAIDRVIAEAGAS